jgi:hypothetical protein
MDVYDGLRHRWIWDGTGPWSREERSPRTRGLDLCCNFPVWGLDPERKVGLDYSLKEFPFE